jgi:hypothetical protein
MSFCSKKFEKTYDLPGLEEKFAHLRDGALRNNDMKGTSSLWS